jgi:predicted acetyltransferase
VPHLIAPTPRLHATWLDSHEEWGPGLHEDGFGLAGTDEVCSPAGFAAWVARVTLEAERTRSAYRWIVEGDRVLGGIVLRHGPADFVEWAGHIGYGVRPSARGAGLATWALGLMLDEARAAGLDRVLLVCKTDNAGSARTIERNGGVLEEAGPLRRYWIAL